MNLNQLNIPQSTTPIPPPNSEKIFSKRRLIKLSIVALVGFLGIMLATQTVSPGSVASPVISINIHQTNTNVDNLQFDYRIRGVIGQQVTNNQISIGIATHVSNLGAANVEALCRYAGANSNFWSPLTYGRSSINAGSSIKTTKIAKVDSVFKGSIDISLTAKQKSYQTKVICLKYDFRPIGRSIGDTTILGNKKIIISNPAPNPSENAATSPILTIVPPAVINNNEIRVQVRSSQDVYWYTGITDSDGICRAKTVENSNPHYGVTTSRTKTYTYSGTISPNLNGQYVCFKARNASGRSAHRTQIISGLSERDTTAPTITTTVVSMTDSRIEVRATSNEPVHWYKGIVGGLSSCTQQRVVTNAGSGAAGAALDRTRNQTYLRTQGISISWNNRRVVCFKATDAAGNTAHVGVPVEGIEIRLNITASTINNNQIRASATASQDVFWYGGITSSIANCRAKTVETSNPNYGVTTSRTRIFEHRETISPLFNGQYICFKVRNTVGDSNYVTERISGLVSQSQSPRDDPQAPQVQQQGQSITIGSVTITDLGSNQLRINYANITPVLTAVTEDDVRHLIVGTNSVSNVNSQCGAAGLGWKNKNHTDVVSYQFHKTTSNMAGHRVIRLTDSNGQRRPFYSQFTHYYACVKIHHSATVNTNNNQRYTIGGVKMSIPAPVNPSENNNNNNNDNDNAQRGPVESNFNVNVSVAQAQAPATSKLRFNYTVSGLPHQAAVSGVTKEKIQYVLILSDTTVSPSQAASKCNAVHSARWTPLGNESTIQYKDTRNDVNSIAGEGQIALTDNQRRAAHHVFCLRVHHKQSANSNNRVYTYGSSLVDIQPPPAANYNVLALPLVQMRYNRGLWVEYVITGLPADIPKARVAYKIHHYPNAPSLQVVQRDCADLSYEIGLRWNSVTGSDVDYHKHTFTEGEGNNPNILAGVLRINKKNEQYARASKLNFAAICLRVVRPIRPGSSENTYSFSSALVDIRPPAFSITNRGSGNQIALTATDIANQNYYWYVNLLVNSNNLEEAQQECASRVVGRQVIARQASTVYEATWTPDLAGKYVCFKAEDAMRNSAYLIHQIRGVNEVVVVDGEERVAVTLNPADNNDPDGQAQRTSSRGQAAAAPNSYETTLAVTQQFDRQRMKFNYVINGLPSTDGTVKKVEYSFVGTATDESVQTVCRDSNRDWNNINQLDGGPSTYRIDLSNVNLNHNYHTICVRVEHKVGSGSTAYTFTTGGAKLDVKGPVLKITQQSINSSDGLQATVKANETARWYAGILDTQDEEVALQTECPAKVITGNYVISKQLREDYDADLVGKLVCFKAEDNMGNASVLVARVILRQTGANPTTTINRQGDTYAAQPSGNEETATVQHVVIDNPNKCNAVGLSGKTLTTGQSFEVPANQRNNYNKKYVCFKTTAGDQITYDWEQIDLEPIVQIKQPSGLTFKAVADESIKTWRYIIVDQANCQASSFDIPATQISSGQTFTVPVGQKTQYDNKYICFEAVDLNDDKGYKSKRMNLAPAVNIVKDGLTFEAVADESIKAWRYLISDSQTCDLNYFKANLSNVVTGSRKFTVSANQKSNYHNKYICFEGQDQNNLRGYKSKKMLVQTINSVSQYVKIKEQANSVYVASLNQNENANWRYAIISDNAACRASGFLAPTEVFEGLKLTVAANKKQAWHEKYVCFEAELDNGVKHYGYYQMLLEDDDNNANDDNNALTLSVGRTILENGFSFTAKLTPDQPASWQYVILDQSNQCVAGSFTDVPSTQLDREFFVGFEQGIEYDGKYVCFEATVNTGEKYRAFKSINFDVDQATSTGDEPNTEVSNLILPRTGIIDSSGNPFFKWGGFVIIVGAILAVIRIFLVKKHNKIV